MKKIKFVLKTILFCVAAVLSAGIAQAQNPLLPAANNTAPFGTNGNLIQNWSFELPATGKITTGWDSVTNWFSNLTVTPSDSGVQGGNSPNVTEASYDGVWESWLLETNGYRAKQTTSHIIHQGECFLVSVASKNEWVNNVGWTKIDGYLSVALYYGGGPTNEGIPFFTNNFVIHPAPGGGSHNLLNDWTNYFFGVITDAVPSAAIGTNIGIKIWESSSQYNTNVDSAISWLDFDGVIIVVTNGIAPIASPVALTPTNSVWGGEHLFFTENCFGSLPLAYQWQWQTNGVGGYINLDGQTTSNLEVISTTNIGTYNYRVIITNNTGSATSAVVPYTVKGQVRPYIIQDTGTQDFGPITNILAYTNSSVNLHAAFDGPPTITNQWFSDTGGGYTAMAGATNDYYTLTNVQSAANGWYRYSATNGIGSSNSTPSHLTTLANPGPPNNVGTNAYSNCIFTNHPWAYWKFEEQSNSLTSSVQAYDYSGHNFDATYGNGDGTTGSGCRDGAQAWLQSHGGPGSSMSSEAYTVDHYAGFPSTNQCAQLSYNHNNGFISVPPLHLNTNNNVTFTMWIYPSSDVISVSSGLLINRNGSDGAGIGFGTVLQTNSGGRSMPNLTYTWNSNNPATYGWDTGLHPLGGLWSFVACVITPTNTTMYLYYVGGTPVQTNLVKAFLPNTTNNVPEDFGGIAATRIGGDSANGNARTFDGSIDEVAVFTNSMSENQIQGLFLLALNLTNGVAPAFTTQPAAHTTFYQNQMMQLTAAAGGIPNPSLQWQFSWDQSKWTNVVNDITKDVGGSTDTTLHMTNYPNAYYYGCTNFRCIAANSSGSVTSSVAVVTLLQIVGNSGSAPWTVNFAVATTNQNGRSTPFSGRGVLGSGTYWNILNGDNGQVTNVTSLRDNGITYSGIQVSTPPGHFCGTPGSSLWTGVTNNMLLDTYAVIGSTNLLGPVTTPLVFSHVPNGKYNLALYGCVGNWLNRAIKFTVLTNGLVAGTAAMTNLQDTLLLPNDNTAVFTNLLVLNSTLEVDMVFMPCPANTNPITGEGEFNGAQLQLIRYAPQVTNLNLTTHSLGWVSGGLFSSTNVMGPWVTNPGVSPITFTPTGYMQFYRVYNPKW